MPYSQRYLVLGLVGLVGLVGLALWLVSGIALNKYRCENATLNSMFAIIARGLVCTISCVIMQLFCWVRLFFFEPQFSLILSCCVS